MSTCLTDQEYQLLSATNQYRAQNGLLALRPSAALMETAQAHADDLAANDYFDHTSLDGRDVGDRAEDAGYPNSWVGENIAAGYDDPERTHNQWVNSPGHRANLLNHNYTEMGIARAQGGRYRWVWVQVFGGASTPLTKPCAGAMPAPAPRPIPVPIEERPESAVPGRLPTSRPPREIRQQRRRMRRLQRRLGLRP